MGVCENVSSNVVVFLALYLVYIHGNYQIAVLEDLDHVKNDIEDYVEVVNLVKIVFKHLVKALDSDKVKDKDGSEVAGNVYLPVKINFGHSKGLKQDLVLFIIDHRHEVVELNVDVDYNVGVSEIH